MLILAASLEDHRTRFKLMSSSFKWLILGNRVLYYAFCMRSMRKMEMSRVRDRDRDRGGFFFRNRGPSLTYIVHFMRSMR